MSSKVEQLLKAGGANMANSLGQGATPAARPTLAAVPAGGDRYNGRTKGSGGEMLLANIVPDPDQPRTEFDPDELRQLADSLKTHGQLQPIRVRWSQPHGKWVVIAGERRYRAAHLAGLAKLACVFVEQDEMPADVLLEEQLIENAIRSDLKPVEQARAFRRLMDMKGYTGKQVAERLQLHPTTVTRALQLLELPEQIQARVEEGIISPSVGVELAKVESADDQEQLAEKIVADKLTRTEAVAAVAAKRASAKKSRGAKAKPKPPAGPAREKKFTYKTGDNCTVTLAFRKASTSSEVRNALLEILDRLGPAEQAA